MRAEGEERIEFLAKVRNRALEPLWRGAGGNGSVAVTGEGFRADRIVFVNDVFFCARDVVRCSFPGTPHFCAVHLHQADHLANRQHFTGHILKNMRGKNYKETARRQFAAQQDQAHYDG